MNANDYQDNLCKVYLVAQILLALPLEEMHEAQARADAIGPLIDPTAYVRKGKALADDMRVTEILLTARRTLRQDFPTLKPAIDESESPRAES